MIPSKNPAMFTLVPLLTEAVIPNVGCCRNEAKGVTSEMARTRSETFLLHSLHWWCPLSCFPSNTNLILSPHWPLCVVSCVSLPSSPLGWKPVMAGTISGSLLCPGPHLWCLIGNRLLKYLSNKERIDGRKGDVYGTFLFTVLPGMLLTLYLLLSEKNSRQVKGIFGLRVLCWYPVQVIAGGIRISENFRLDKNINWEEKPSGHWILNSTEKETSQTTKLLWFQISQAGTLRHASSL